MKKHMIILLMFMLWASQAVAQQATEAKGTESQEGVFEGLAGPTYYWVSQYRGARAGEYDYLKSSVGGDLHLEYDPLPHRLDVETHFLNRHDYFGEADYAYRDIVLFNFVTRNVYHNLDHLAFGPDGTTTTSPSFTDLNPADQYAIDNTLRKGFLRLKTPDFPFHLYADAATIDRNGSVQQRFLQGTGGLNLVSQTRYIDWTSREVRVGVNSHLGPVEVDYSHTTKKFESLKDKVLFDVTTPHNQTPELTSATDTVKVHTSHSGKVAAAATYSSGVKKNLDSDVKADFRNAAGDITLTPVANLVFFLKYRHYDLREDNPATVTLSGVDTFNVRNSISSKRDVMDGTVRYRFSPRLTVKGEYTVETIERDVWNGASLTPLQTAPTATGNGDASWDLAHRTLKSTARVGLSYRLMSKLSLRADYSQMAVSNPAYADDPDQASAAKATVTWSPVKRVIALASYGGVREKRNSLSAPLAGGNRKVDRDQALGSLTFLVGKRSSVTAGYMYFKNKTDQTLTYTNPSGVFIIEDHVPYGDKAEVVSLSATHSATDGVTLTAGASKSYSQGNFRTSGAVPGTTGIDTLSDMRVVEDIYTAGLELQLSKTIGSEFRFQRRQYDDKIDNTQDSRVDTALATLYVKW